MKEHLSGVGNTCQIWVVVVGVGEKEKDEENSVV